MTFRCKILKIQFRCSSLLCILNFRVATYWFIEQIHWFKRWLEWHLCRYNPDLWDLSGTGWSLIKTVSCQNADQRSNPDDLNNFLTHAEVFPKRCRGLPQVFRTSASLALSIECFTNYDALLVYISRHAIEIRAVDACMLVRSRNARIVFSWDTRS